MRKVFILNNSVKKQVKYELINNIKKNMSEENIIIEKTISSRHATLIAQKYAKDPVPTHLYICGGDGTIHEVVNGVANQSHIKISIIPIGTGNDFIKSFTGLKKEDFFDLSNYKNPIEKDIDLLKINGEYAINTISLGFDVKVSEEVNKMKREHRLTGKSAYYFCMLKVLSQLKNDPYEIHIDKKETKGKYTFVVFSNGKYYGGGYMPCPQAKFDDGIIDICLIKEISKWQLLRLAKKYEKGDHVNYPKYAQIYKGKAIHVNTGNEKIHVNLDGEIRQMSNLVIEVEKKAIHLLLPNKG
ncbi:MAG: diacylglycerol kinase family lipid kinase [Bacillota bacterium]|nr:diacylglycerol kinase family lipid kinase [Bacillota bacterium]